MENEKKEPLKVYLVNPPSENPWRTQKDYLEDQLRAKRLFQISIAGMIVSIIAVVTTAITAVESIKRMSESRVVTVQAQLPNGKELDRKLVAKAESNLKEHIEFLKSGKSETGILRWRAIRNLHYEIKSGDAEGAITASLVYEEDFSDGTPFLKFSRRELELTYIEDKWLLTSGRHRFIAPAGEKNPTPDWTPFAPGNSTGIAMGLRIGYQFK